MITCRDGLLKGPDGTVRQIPQKEFYSSAVWITRTGTARRRLYNVVTRQFEWAEESLQPTMDIEGRLGFNLDYWTPVATAIALAWKKRAPGARAYVSVEEGSPPSADTVKFVSQDTRDDGAEVEGETWSPLKGLLGIVKLDAYKYSISDKGRLRNPRGEVTRGFWYDSRHWGSVEGVGLVDLNAAAGIEPVHEHTLSPKIEAARAALLHKVHPHQFAVDAAVKVQTSWNYYMKASVNVDAATLRRRVSSIVSRDMWRLLRSMQEEESELFGGPLRDLHPHVQSKLDPDGDWVTSEFQWEQLRFARMALTRSGL